MDLPLGPFDASAVMAAARSFLRPIDWRRNGPTPEDLRGCLLFERPERATSFDGTRIAYGVYGSRGSRVALVPGFCCPDNFWRYCCPPSP